ncbi:MAG: TonB-dependent receptor plug domain-containing protein [Paludibacteraceae bacterium]
MDFKIKYYYLLAGLLLSNVCAGQSSKNTAEQTSDTSTLHRVELKDITVTAKYLTSRNNAYQYLPQSAKPLVTVLGGTDVVRYIGTLPGVSQGMEGGMGFFVRGGNSANNRIELDGVPVYGSTHLFGLFSTFHADIVQSTNFRTGSISASTGDFLSSITQIKSMDPDTAKIHGSFTISPFLIGLSANGRINKKISYVGSGRLSLLRPEYMILKWIAKPETDVNPQIADLFLKINYEVNPKHLLSASGYFSNDYFSFTPPDAKIGMNWGNRFARLGWDWIVSDHTKLQTLGYYNHFFSGQLQRILENSEPHELVSELRVRSTLSEQVVQTTLIHERELWSLQVGLLYKGRQFQPASQKILTGKDTVANLNNPLASNSVVLFTEGAYKFNKLLATVGVRANLYNSNKLTKLLMDARFNANYALSTNSGFEFSYDLLSQTHHAVEGLPMGWSLDLLVPSDSVFLPEIAHQFYTGGYWGNDTYSLSGGAYLKRMNNLISYKNSTNLFGEQSENWQEEIAVGTGLSYGIELRAERKSEKWNATLSYTLSKTTRRYAELNAGMVFPAKFDRRHILNLNTQVITRKLKTKGQNLNLALSYSSGHNATVPIGMYKGEQPPFWDIHGGYKNWLTNENVYGRELMSGVNEFKLPAYFRIDIGYAFVKKRKKTTRELTLGVYNILNRKNPYLMFYQDDRWQQLSILPIIPSIQWSITF